MERDMRLWRSMQAVAASMGVRSAYKDQSWFMRILGWILFFNPAFMTRYTTTIGKTVYFPNRETVEQNPRRYALVLAHELQHVADQRDQGTFAFVTKYLEPQWWVVAGLVPLCVPQAPWWLALPSLVALLPVGSTGRTELELRGYGMTIAMMVWMGDGMVAPPSWIVDQFTSMAYFRMCPDKAMVVSALERYREQALRGHVDLQMSSRVKPLADSWRQAG